MFGAFKKKFKHEYENSEFNLEPVYETKDGYKFYCYKEPIQVPYGRIELALLYTRYAQMCMTPERLNEFLEEILKANKKGDTNRVGALAMMMQVSEERFAEPESLKLLASVFTVLEGEPAGEYLENWQEKKFEIWENDKRCRDFFLLWAYKRFPDLIEISVADFLKNMDQQREAEKIYRSMLSHTSGKRKKRQTHKHTE